MALTGAELFTTGGGGGAISTENVVYVAKNGSDVTGVRNELSNPFLTLEAAVAVALAGDLIVVYPGQYDVTTTALNGIAKDGVSYYFYPETLVRKTTIGDIFNVDGFGTGFNVYGQGDFSKTNDAGHILWAGANGIFNIGFDMTFEARDVFNTTASWSFSYSTVSSTPYPKATFKVRNVLCTGGGIFALPRYGDLDIEATNLKSTAGSVLAHIPYGQYMVRIKANRVESTSTVAILGQTYSTASYDINYCYGVSYAYSFSAYAIATINGYASGIYMTGNGVLVTHNGQCSNLLQLAGSFSGNQVNVASITGGVSSFSLVHAYYPTTLTQSGGEANVILLNSNVTSYSMLITGGKLNVIGFVENDQDYVNVVINGVTAEVVWDVRVLGSTFFGVYSSSLCYITLTEGILRLKNVIENRITTSSDASCIAYNGGTLIIDGGTLITANAECPVIRVGIADRNIKVLSAGLSSNRTENGGTLSAKKYKSQFTVSAVATTTVIINGTSITETDVATYNTIPLLAQRMAALINADPTTSALVDATQDTGGTDVYFYLEADTAGTIITITGLINLVELSLRQNSFALTNTTLGPILENINVE